jgi:NAD(P)-dependent dehydrogenase (short-subunit alcohol dehydrogenase family)
VSRILVTGSTTGVGFAAAAELVIAGHEVVFHARTAERAASVEGIGAGVVIGDLGEPAQVLDLVRTLRALGRFDVVIHNAGIDSTAERVVNSVRQPLVTAVNLFAPYVMTASMHRPDRLIFLSSGWHYDGHGDIDDVEWIDRPWDGVQAYCDSKLLLTAFMLALARRWPDVACHAVDPGWVPTRMGGVDAPDELELGHPTQVWLASSDDRAALASGGYWFHMEQFDPANVAQDRRFQDQLVERLTAITAVELDDGDGRAPTVGCHER